jgi:hypothetical protein
MPRSEPTIHNGWYPAQDVSHTIVPSNAQISLQRISVRGVTSQPLEYYLESMTEADQCSVNCAVEICSNYAQTKISNTPYIFLVSSTIGFIP